MDGVEKAAAVAFGTMGIAALVRPRTITDLMGLAIVTPTGENEVRGVYGGFGVVTAAMLAAPVASVRRSARRAAGVALLSMAAGRAADLALGGRPTPAGRLAMAGETAMGAALLGPQR